jgi:saccharopine dehydrogenase (NAD+, L-lysine-forming)
MKIVVLGGYGIQGSIICADLVKNPRITEVICAGRDLNKAQNLVNWLNSEKLTAQQVNVSKRSDLEEALKNTDVVVNSTVPQFNLAIMNAASSSGTNYVDLASGPPYNILYEQLRLCEQWEKAGLTGLIDTGISPGVTNVLAKKAADALDHVDELRIRFFVTFKATEAMSRWSPETRWADMAEQPAVFENGNLVKVPPFSGEETYKFPDPYGPQPVVHHAHEEPYTIPRFIQKGLRYMDFKYSHDPIAEAIVNMGLLDENPVEIKGIRVAPRDVLFALSPPTVAIDEMASKIEAGIVTATSGCALVEARKKANDLETKYTLYAPFPSIHEVNERIPGATHTSYVTGVPAAVFAALIAEEAIETKGVLPPECLDAKERNAFLSAIQGKGIVVCERIENQPVCKSP